MADLKLRNRPIYVGAKLSVLVEQALTDILIVCLKHDSKCFRGVLLDTDKRNLPHGINLPLLPGLSQEMTNSKTTGMTDASKDQADKAINDKPDWSGLSLRHTYQQDVTKLGGKFTDISKRSTTRHFKDKTVRNIRLRPRQTLCSKCKLACHDQGNKNLSNNSKESTKNSNDLMVSKSSDSPHTARPGLRGRAVRSKPHRIELRKRPLIPVIDAYPRVKLQRLDSSKFVKSDSSPIRQPEVSKPEDNFADRGPPEIEAAPPPLSAPPLLSAPPKVSPIIKISIGEGTVLKIPPRLHEIKESEGEFDEDDAITNDQVHDLTLDEVQLEMPILEMQGGSSNYLIKSKSEEIIPAEDKNAELREKTGHRKRKKALKKARSREKHRSLDCGSHSENTHPEKHHKHKKKHKHRHNHETLERRTNSMVARSPLSSTSFTADKQLCASGENISPPDSDPEEEVSQKDRNERPRLLYRWRQKDGLPSLEPKHFTDSDLSSNNGSFLIHTKDNNLDENYELESNSIKQNWSNYSSIQNSPREILSNYSSQSTVISDCKDKLECLSDMAPSDYEENEDGFPGNLTPDHDSRHYDDADKFENLDSFENFKPSLMMRIQTRSVVTCEIADGRLISVGDIVWGKIQGFPWWPGRILSISISQKDDGLIINQMAQVTWFGSSTMSHIQCSDLFPFLDDFDIRYNKKKRGPYKMAIKQATIAAQRGMNGHQNIDIEEFDL